MFKINSIRKSQDGFTLVEMLIVIFIIGVILAIATPNLKASGEKAQAKACLANQKLIQVQLDNYYLENNHYPDQTTFVADLAKAGYLNTIVECPSGGTYSFTDDTIDTTTGLTHTKVSCNVHTE